MSNKSETLRLADELEDEHDPWPRLPAAAELRRLHASCEDYAQHKQRQDQRVLELAERVLELKAQRDTLLEALAVVLLEAEHTLLEPTRRKARAAIKAVEGEGA